MHWPYKNSLSNHVCHPRQIQTYEVCQPGMLLIHCLAHFQQQQTVTPPQDGTFCDKCASWSWAMQRALLSLQPDVIAPELVQQGSTTSHESCLTKATSLLAVLAIALPCHLLISTCRCMPWHCAWVNSNLSTFNVVLCIADLSIHAGLPSQTAFWLLVQHFGSGFGVLFHSSSLLPCFPRCP